MLKLCRLVDGRHIAVNAASVRFIGPTDIVNTCAVLLDGMPPNQPILLAGSVREVFDYLEGRADAAPDIESETRPSIIT